VDDWACSIGLNQIHAMPVILERKIGLARKSIHVSAMLVLMSVLAVLIAPESFRTVSVPNASAVSVAGSGVGVYWDQVATSSCVSIFWGALAPGENKSFILYVRNEANESLYYLLMASQWNPVDASRFMSLHWSYDGSRMGVGSVLRVLLTLSVSRLVRGVSDFSFDVVIFASHYLLGDVNFDGRVDISDLAIIVKAFGFSVGSVVWNSNADVNGDGTVDVLDLAVAAKNFGRSV